MVIIKNYYKSITEVLKKICGMRRDEIF